VLYLVQLALMMDERFSVSLSMFFKVTATSSFTVIPLYPQFLQFPCLELMAGKKLVYIVPVKNSILV
jgi:hypothetical protein